MSSASPLTPRREFFRRSSVILAGAAASVCGLDALVAAETDDDDKNGGKPAPLLRIGLLTDIHYADRKVNGTRHYRDALAKMRPAIQHFNKVRADFAVEVGDLVDEGPDAKAEASFVDRIDVEFARFRGDRHYVLGNHCIWTLTKREFFAHCGDRKPRDAGYYSFDRGDFHFVVLDACYRADGTPYGRRNNKWTDTEIPPAQRAWLAKDLAKTRRKTIVFVHQRLDVPGKYAVKSAAAVRKILAKSGVVLAVFQGHNHVNDLRRIDGIHYVTLDAMIEGPGSDAKNNAWSVLEIYGGGLLRVDGFRRQKDWALPVVI